jgi:hypothetical protein
MGKRVQYPKKWVADTTTPLQAPGSLQAPSSWLLLLLVIVFFVLAPQDVLSLSLSLSLPLNPKPFSPNFSLLAKLES